MGLTLEATIDELSPGGDGVAICEIAGERRAVFVGGVVRGERVRVEVNPARRPARAKLLAVLEPSSARVPPPCKHVDRCGGCDWMHIAPSEQAVEHARIVEKLLRVGPDVRRAVHRAPLELRYRTRARVHIEAKRGRVDVGMFGRRSHEPASVDTCVVLDPALDRARALLGSWLDGARGRGEALLSLGPPGAAGAERRAVIDLRWDGDLPATVFASFERATLESLAGARIFAGEVRVPAIVGDPTPFIEGADGERLRLSPGGFSQATEAGNVLLARRVAELARTLPRGPCVELYAGPGNLSVLLAKDRELVIVEQDDGACAAAKDNLSARSLVARVVAADAATFTIPKGTSLVVLDPPREGARAVAEAIAARARGSPSAWAKDERGNRRPPSVIYVSCDPPTLARDVRSLEDSGYVMDALETFEMFPNTSHVETVAVLVPRPRQSGSPS